MCVGTSSCLQYVMGCFNTVTLLFTCTPLSQPIHVSPSILAVDIHSKAQGTQGTGTQGTIPLHTRSCSRYIARLPWEMSSLFYTGVIRELLQLIYRGGARSLPHTMGECTSETVYCRCCALLHYSYSGRRVTPLTLLP